MTSLVYFMKPIGQPGPIKIGHSKHTEGRLTTMMAWSPVRLEIIATVAGSYELEKRLHESFAYAHSHGEWFHAVDELVNGINALALGTPIEQAFDIQRKTGSIRKNQPRIMARFTPQYRQRLSYHHSFNRWSQKFWATDFRYRLSDLAENLMDTRYSQNWLSEDDVAALEKELKELKEFASQVASSNTCLLRQEVSESGRFYRKQTA